MKISFVIPAYNEEKNVGACIESAKRACEKLGASYEIVIGDNASTDRTREIAGSYSGVRVIEEREKGANRARQAAFLASNGAFIASIDADTVVPDGWLEKALHELEHDASLVAVSGPFYYYDLSAPARVLVKLFYAGGYLIYLANRFVLRHGSMIQGGNVLIRRDALSRAGGYDTAIDFYGDDTALANELSKIGGVKWTFALSIHASGRRLREEGLVRSGFVYALNHFWIHIFGTPHTKEHEDVRP